MSFQHAIEGWTMKARDSGMPEEAWWRSFFEPDGLIARLLPAHAMDGAIVETRILVSRAGIGKRSTPRVHRVDADPLSLRGLSMPAMSRIDFVMARTMSVPSGVIDHTSLVPGSARMSARISAGTVVCPLEVIVDSAT